MQPIVSREPKSGYERVLITGITSLPMPSAGMRPILRGLWGVPRVPLRIVAYPLEQMCPVRRNIWNDRICILWRRFMGITRWSNSLDCREFPVMARYYRHILSSGRSVSNQWTVFELQTPVAVGEGVSKRRFISLTSWKTLKFRTAKISYDFDGIRLH